MVCDSVNILLIFSSEKCHTAKFRGIDTLNVASFGNSQLLTSLQSHLPQKPSPYHQFLPCACSTAQWY